MSVISRLLGRTGDAAIVIEPMRKRDVPAIMAIMVGVERSLAPLIHFVFWWIAGHE